jgi:hypothetical protein
LLNNFLPLGHLDTFDVVAKLHKLAPHTWEGVPERGEVNSDMIGRGASLLLRGHDPITHENWLHDLPVSDLPALAEWLSMRRLLDQASSAIMGHQLGAHFLSGEMARTMVSRLDPGSTIFWHLDDGPYHGRTMRFHLPLVTNPGCLMYSGPETLHLPAGSLFWFNNHVRHSAANWGPFMRLHLIFEMYRK